MRYGREKIVERERDGEQMWRLARAAHDLATEHAKSAEKKRLTYEVRSSGTGDRRQTKKGDVRNLTTEEENERGKE